VQGWPFRTGQDHLPNHALESIDYVAVHLWPDNWSRPDRPWGVNWVAQHAAQTAALLGKPLVVEEFGKFVGERQSWVSLAAGHVLCCSAEAQQ
jgi:mannan endo-1,4-beta-mannosidase